MFVLPQSSILKHTRKGRVRAGKATKDGRIKTNTSTTHLETEAM
jgi:hypothetical protein